MHCRPFARTTLLPHRVALIAAVGVALFIPTVASAQSSTELLRQAHRLYAEDRYEEAGPLFQQALLAAGAEGSRAAEADARGGIGLVLYQEAKYAEARAALDEARATFQSLGDRAGVARMSRHLGSVLALAGDPEGANRWFDEALAIAEEDGLEIEKARTLTERVFADGGSTEHRLVIIAEALALSRRLGLRELEGTLLHLWGDRLFMTGEFADAQEKLDQAAAIFRATGQRHDQARVLTSLGRLFRAHGQVDRALDCFRDSLALQEDIGDRQGAIQSINTIATALDAQKKFKEAHEWYQRGLSLAEETGSARLIAFMKGNLGGSYMNLGDFGHARELLEAVVAQPMEPYIAGYRYGALASIYLQTKEYRRAVEAAERAVKAVRDANNLERLPTALYQNVQARQATGDLREALAVTNELVAAIEQLRAKLAPSDFMKRGFGDWWANSYSVAVALHHELGEAGPAIEAAEAARARAFVDLLATRNVQGKPADRERMADLQRLDQELKTAGVDPAAPSAALTFRGEAAPSVGTSSLIRRWRTADPELRSFVAAEPLSIADMIATAKRLRSTILSYWVGARETFIGVVTPEGFVRTASVTVSNTRLDELARSTQPGGASAQSASASASAGFTPRTRGADVLALSSGGRDARKELFRLLIRPVSEFLPKEDGALLTIIPHGPLFLVSFAALIDERGAYLLERFTVHYAPSAAVLQYTSGKKQSGSTPRYLLVGDPADLPPRDDGELLPALPGSRREVTAIRQSLHGRDVTLLTGTSAHEDQVRERMAGRTVLHFATHGIVRDDQPFESYLALGRSGGDPLMDGRLTAQEIYALDLHADLVILSACRTGAGRVTGDGIIGLTRAFMYAGTPRVIATLWDVADEPGLYLLPPLYAALDGGQDASRALRSAQLKLLAKLRAGRLQVDGPFGRVTLPEDPLLWAGFVLVGEP